MKEYIIRLDDACEKRDVEKWNRIERILDKYGIRPLVGIIPFCSDPDMDCYDVDDSFWNTVENWREKNWEFALHGYKHVFITEDGGINPVNEKSEFAGVSLSVQKEMINAGIKKLREHGIEPKVFFAPAHTFDYNTLSALKQCSNISHISDTIARKSYKFRDFVFVPQQTGQVRKLPFKTITFCYHPNTMEDKDFLILDGFLKNNHKYFSDFPLGDTSRKIDLIDLMFRKMYFIRRNHKRIG